MSKMGSHHTFGHLKHKLWPKKGPGVKLAVWLPTTKSQELTQFLCLQIACDIPLESSQQGLQLCFNPHLNQRSARKVMAPQSCGSPNLDNFGTPIWESRDKKSVASPKSGPWWVSLDFGVCLVPFKPLTFMKNYFVWTLYSTLSNPSLWIFLRTISFAMILANTTHLYQQTHNSKISFMSVTSKKNALGLFFFLKKTLNLFKVFFFC